MSTKKNNHFLPNKKRKIRFFKQIEVITQSEKKIMKKAIKARPKCGSTNIKMGNIKSGVIYGLTSWRLVCKD